MAATMNADSAFRPAGHERHVLHLMEQHHIDRAHAEREAAWREWRYPQERARWEVA